MDDALLSGKEQGRGPVDRGGRGLLFSPAHLPFVYLLATEQFWVRACGRHQTAPADLYAFRV